MRTILQDAADHPAAGTARSHLQEQAHAVGVGMFDHVGEVDSFKRLGQYRIGRALAVDLVGCSGGAAVEADSGWRGGGEEMQLPVWAAHFPGHLAVDRGHTVEREEAAAELLHGLRHLAGLAADHAFIGGVDDQQVDAPDPLQSAPHLL